MKVVCITWCRTLVSPPEPIIGHTARRHYLSPTMRTARLALIATSIVAACRPATAPSTGPRPARTQPAPNAPAVALPALPLVEGPLAPRVVYPQSGQFIQSRDSTFILGSVGNGKATLTINGQ